MTRDEAKKILIKTLECWDEFGPKTHEGMITWLLTGGAAIHAKADEEAFFDAAYDEAMFLDDGVAECAFCDNEITTRLAPEPDDEVGWARVGKEHTKKCQDTRAGRRTAPKKPRKPKSMPVTEALVPVTPPTARLSLVPLPRAVPVPSRSCARCGVTTFGALCTFCETRVVEAR